MAKSRNRLSDHVFVPLASSVCRRPEIIFPFSKNAGIVLESSPDKRNDIYSVDIENLRSVSPGLIEVLRG